MRGLLLPAQCRRPRLGGFRATVPLRRLPSKALQPRVLGTWVGRKENIGPNQMVQWLDLNFATFSPPSHINGARCVRRHDMPLRSMRTVSGLALCLSLSTAVDIVAAAIKRTRRRNTGSRGGP